nr:cupin domain-containing protein [Phytoactinopolyspora alkaliphila]
MIRLPAGSRGHWHRHADGQVVHVVQGAGLVGRRGEDPLQVTTGDIVWIEPDEEHWHGSAAGSDLAQLAYSFGAITWLEPSL